ncbi:MULTISPECIES: SDR family oxidoreductase [unclassified Rathayibacter]|uniref:SDR family NAD(P)-dependent oxidoreductase n=1 Tax=unclassified Rathayibacter TaxID=2609250 RepID=UPI000F4D1EA8|nr:MULTISPECIES: SDR family oxidoreductase [unclassified Rathayibacter]ROQ52581.1 NAD(P)-dependent dehydrogenase (short-subunit alcohol dehydrogenase family) [Rathayibacter sp. PhB152]TCL83090.1 NAD(P)-dependent dehydrogenase (short-subunit alcohol dehydrogenase family) [Rathayibacter sp. PhB192]TCM28588.1 NAD(P)-dependent dehydrogenase (short-subunit alcohol dehydrogenase family) [Rathayibacter sp. PhB179]
MLTSKNTLQEWLDDAVGGPLLREILAQGGQSAEDLRPAAGLSLRTLVELGGGRFPQELVDTLVKQANGGVIPLEETQEESVGDGRFTGRTVIVTGAGSGIGRATARRILREGGRVIAVDVVPKGIDELAASSPEGTVVTVTADITSTDGVAEILSAAGERVDGLANIAGIMDGMTPLHETEDALWRRVFSVNVDGTFALSRAVLPLMLAQGRGSVVNIASEASLRGNAAGTAYTASKHAVVGITKSAAFLYGPSGIRTNAVAPGPTATAIEGSMASDFGRERLAPFFTLIPPVVSADTMAASITWLLSDDSANVNGIVLASDGGWSVQ